MEGLQVMVDYILLDRLGHESFWGWCRCLEHVHVTGMLMHSQEIRALLHCIHNPMNTFSESTSAPHAAI
jgi:hypothetical protein